MAGCIAAPPRIRYDAAAGDARRRSTSCSTSTRGRCAPRPARTARASSRSTCCRRPRSSCARPRGCRSRCGSSSPRRSTTTAIAELEALIAARRGRRRASTGLEPPRRRRASSSPPTASCARGRPSAAGPPCRIPRWRCPPRAARRSSFARLSGDLEAIGAIAGARAVLGRAARATARRGRSPRCRAPPSRRRSTRGLERAAPAAGPRARGPAVRRSSTRARELGDALAGYEILWSDATRVLLALDAATANDEIPAHGAHGHFRFLTPSPELLRPARVLALARDRAPARACRSPRAAGAGDRASPTSPTSRATPASRRSTRAARCARATARTPTTRARSTRSLADLTELGYAPFTHEFSFGGRILRNVIADLPGSGELGVDAGILVVGCHLDSTAARDPGYVPGVEPGPRRRRRRLGRGRAARDRAPPALARRAAAQHRALRLLQRRGVRPRRKPRLRRVAEGRAARRSSPSSAPT